MNKLNLAVGLLSVASLARADFIYLFDKPGKNGYSFLFTSPDSVTPPRAHFLITPIGGELSFLESELSGSPGSHCFSIEQSEASEGNRGDCAHLTPGLLVAFSDLLGTHDRNIFPPGDRESSFSGDIPTNPEPSTIVLLATVLVGVAMLRRKRRTTAPPA
jgi:hypothetical protein